MTEKLKTLLHERATSVDFAAPDLDAMARAGDHTLRRRRRSLAVVGGVAAAAVLVTAVALVPGARQPDSAGVTGHDRPTAPLTWVTGATLHTTDGPDVELGHEVRAYVRTGEGFVLADREGTVRSWTDGQARAVGRVDGASHLVADGESGLAGWLDASTSPAIVRVLDQRTGATTTIEVEPGSVPAHLVAVDDGAVFLFDGRGLVSVPVQGGDPVVVEPSPQVGSRVIDVEEELFATTTGAGTAVGSAPAEGVELAEAYGSVGVLSPDGRYYSSEGDEQAVFDTRSGERVQLDLEQRFATGYEWLDDSTLAVLAADRPRMDATAQLLTCSVPDGDCTMVEDDLGTLAELQGSLALPTGDHPG
jgi:hypothetical protein